MRILALDTATAATAAALVDTVTGLQLEARDDPPQGSRPSHASALLRLVEEVLSQSGGGWEAVDRIAVGLGPGTFTGLRIGIATAHGLARASGKPLVGVSTLESLALGAANGWSGEGAGDQHALLAVIDARRNEAFAAVWRRAGGGVASVSDLNPTVLTPEALDAEARRQVTAVSQVLAIGDGAIKFRELLEAAGITVPEDGSHLHRVSALWHCRLAETAPPQPLSGIQPQYLRVPDAELNR